MFITPFKHTLKYTTLVYFKSAKSEQQILYLMHFNCAEVVLKSN